MSDSVVIISTGEELLSGELIDTNGVWLAGELWGLGLRPRAMLTAGDDLDGLVWAIETSASLGSFVILTGGLGPTQDDRSAQAAALWAGVAQADHPEALAQITARFKARGLKVSKANQKQAFLPEGAEVLENRWGSAPGFRLSHKGSTLVCLPGVPVEMKRLFEAYIRPTLAGETQPSLHCLNTFGLAEARIQMMLDGLDLGGAELGFRANIPQVQVKLRFDRGVKKRIQNTVVAAVSEVLGDALFSVDGRDLAETVVAVLGERGHTISLAESCTAGMTAAWIADVPGASAVLMEAVVVYADAAKTRAVGVPEAMLREHGAVSEAVCCALADGIKARTGTTYALGITGIAGPGGGSEAKPVGTVYIAVAGPGGTHAQHLVIPGTRAQVRKRAAGAALAAVLHCAKSVQSRPEDG